MNASHRPICHLITSLSTGGAQLSLVRLLGADTELRESSAVVSLTGPEPLGERLQQLGVPVEYLAMTRGRPTIGGLWRLVRYLRKTKPLLVQTWLYHADLLGLIAGRVAGVPAIVWNIRAAYMDMSKYHALSGLTLRACAFVSPFASAVVVNSRAGQQAHMAVGYRPRRWVVVPNGIDTAQFRPDPQARVRIRSKFGIGDAAILIGLVARFDPMKDHLNFLRAAAALNRQRPDVRFVLVGEGVVRGNGRLEAVIQSAGANIDSLVLAGQQEDIAAMTASFDIATCSSYGEAFPNVVAEAMACEVPVVATDVGDCREIIGDTGLVVPPRSPEALTSAWERLICAGAEERARLGRLARDRVRARYGLDAWTRQFRELYRPYIGSFEVRV